MRERFLLLCLSLLASCASGPTENEQLMAELEARNAQEAAAEKKLQDFISKTPFEVCTANPDLVKRYGGMKDCKDGVKDEQKRAREELANARAEKEARRNILLQHYLRKNFR